MKKLIKPTIFIAVLLAATSLFSAISKAQTESIPLLIAPARQTINVKPGELTGAVVKFFNTGPVPISGTFKVADFIVDNNQGAPQFIEGPSVASPRFAAAKWVTLTHDRATLPGNGVVLVQATIRVPKDASPGGKYFAIIFEPVANVGNPAGSQEEGSSAIAPRIAALVYLRVAGPITENASVIRFAAPSLSEYGPAQITTEILNQGDYHISPKGQIVLKNMFGAQVAKSELQPTNIFPDASRIYTNSIGPKWMFGKFTATLNATYGDTNKPLTAAASFWIFPWKLILVIILALIILILGGVLIYSRFIKKEKKLEAEIAEERKELEGLKEQLQDKISSITPEAKKTPPPPEEKK